MSRDCKPPSSCHSERLKSGDSGFQTMFRWASHIGVPDSNIDCPLDNSLRASPGPGVRYSEGSGLKSQRPMSAPVRRRACMQTSNRPHSASRRARCNSTLSGAAMGGSKARDQHGACSTTQNTVVCQPQWQGKTAYRHESSAIRTKLARQRNRPMSAI